MTRATVHLAASALLATAALFLVGVGQRHNDVEDFEELRAVRVARALGVDVRALVS